MQFIRYCDLQINNTSSLRKKLIAEGVVVVTIDCKPYPLITSSRVKRIQSRFEIQPVGQFFWVKPRLVYNWLNVLSFDHT